MELEAHYSSVFPRTRPSPRCHSEEDPPPMPWHLWAEPFPTSPIPRGRLEVGMTAPSLLAALTHLLCLSASGTPWTWLLLSTGTTPRYRELPESTEPGSAGSGALGPQSASPHTRGQPRPASRGSSLCQLGFLSTFPTVMIRVTFSTGAHNSTAKRTTRSGFGRGRIL